MNTHTLRNKRHWSPSSEPYATGDVLVRHLHMGWTVQHVELVVFPCTGYRQISVHRFSLAKEGCELQMSVVTNPTVMRLVEEFSCFRMPDCEQQRLVQQTAW